MRPWGTEPAGEAGGGPLAEGTPRKTRAAWSKLDCLKSHPGRVISVNCFSRPRCLIDCATEELLLPHDDVTNVWSESMRGEISKQAKQ